MIAKAHSCGLLGLDGYIVEVEADISSGMPAFDIVGLPDAAVKESKERVRTAMKNCNMDFPTKRITVNLAPANLKKEGPAYDLPISVAILASTGQLPLREVAEYFFVGELALDGRIRGVNGILPMVMAAVKNGFNKVIVSADNAKEAAIVADAKIYPISNLHELMMHFSGQREIERFEIDLDRLFDENNVYEADFSDVKGQEDVKRAIEVAVAGGHNIIMIGSPGSGKSMMAQRIPTILPDLTFEEALEVTKIHSIAGVLDSGTPLLTTRPFRSPHHTISASGLSGGGSVPKPGELSLAHNGVLFMDELPEFHRDVLEGMRQPLEDGKVTISRVAGTLTYPCNMLFAASMNPCKCGYYGDPSGKCNCSPMQITRYRSRISGPLLDRIDIHVEVPVVKYKDLESECEVESSKEIKIRIDAARKVQLARYRDAKVYSNSQLTPALLKKYCKLDAGCKELLKTAFENMGLSARAHDRILKVARTIADLEGAENIEQAHLAEAIQYRGLDRKYGGFGYA